MQIAILIGRDHGVARNKSKGGDRSFAGLQRLALTSLLRLKQDPFNIVGLQHGVLHRADGHSDGLSVHLNDRHVLLAGSVGGVGRDGLHFLAAAVAADAGIVDVGLLGTRYTMTQPFYIDVLTRTGINVLVPEGEAIQTVNDIIFNELCLGILRDSSKETLLTAIRQLRNRGAQGVILGCIELGLLVGEGDVELPVFDTAQIHAREAALEALR